jgi:hypothetical protein
LDVPAGFRSASELQKQFRSFTPSRKARSGDNSSLVNADIPAIPSSSLVDSIAHVSHLTTDQSSTANVLILQCIDKKSTSLPSRITLTEDLIRASVGFCRIDSLKQHLSTLYQDTIHLDTTSPDAVLDMGDLATIKKSARNTTPVPRPSSFGDVIHMDIVFGTNVSIGNIHYSLLFTD